MMSGVFRGSRLFFKSAWKLMIKLEQTISDLIFQVVRHLLNRLAALIPTERVVLHKNKILVTWAVFLLSITINYEFIYFIS